MRYLQRRSRSVGNLEESKLKKTVGGFMKFATVLMSLMFAGVFAQAQGAGSEAAPSEVKQEVKAEKSETKVVKADKKHKHGKKEKAAAEGK
jgi:acyl CoA:acetate/3-ketoacid CoA transferase